MTYFVTDSDSINETLYTIPVGIQIIHNMLISMHQYSGPSLKSGRPVLNLISVVEKVQTRKHIITFRPLDFCA